MRRRRKVTPRTHPVIQFFMFAVHFLALAILTILFSPAAVIYALFLIWGLARRIYRTWRRT